MLFYEYIDFLSVYNSMFWIIYKLGFLSDSHGTQTRENLMRVENKTKPPDKLQFVLPATRERSPVGNGGE